MTDTFGTGPHDHDEEIQQESGTEQETDESLEPITEAPSEYEFSDESPLESALEEKPIRRSPVLPVVAALVGIASLGAVAWWQFGSSTPPSFLDKGASGLPSLSTTPTAQGLENALRSDKSLASAITPKTDAVSPKIEGDAQGGDSSSAHPSANQDFEPSASPSDLLAAETSPQIPAVPVETEKVLTTKLPLPPSKESLTAVKEPTVKEKGIPELTLTQASPLKLSEPSTTERIEKASGEMEMLAARVDSLQQSVDELSQRVVELMTSKLAPQSVSGLSAATEKALQQKIEKLEQQVRNIQQQSATSGISIADEKKTLAPAPAKKKVVAKKSTKRKTVKKTVRKTTKKKVAAPKELKPVKALVLRAATPKQAWVAPDKKSLDLKEVHVGDTLPGVGKIVAIEQKGTTWTIRGTKGLIQ